MARIGEQREEATTAGRESSPSRKDGSWGEDGVGPACENLPVKISSNLEQKRPMEEMRRVKKKREECAMKLRNGDR